MGTPGDRRSTTRPSAVGRDLRASADDTQATELDPVDPSSSPISLDGVSVAGITRRRAAFVLAAVLTLWIVAVFARQVGDASAASVRADRMRTANAALSGQVASLESERELIQRQAYIELAARGYGLGTAQERPFALEADAPPLPPNAPGSASVRLGHQEAVRSPLESWLTLLFGPAPSS